MIRINLARSKYGAKRAECDGHSFASKLEAAVYQILRLREKAGEIRIAQIQDHIFLTQARIAYVPDFRCVDLKAGADLWVEAKGFESPRWPVIKKLWAYYGPGPLEIWKGTHQSPQLEETIIPKDWVA